MIDHVSLQVTDVVRSQAFFAAVLAPLGIVPAYPDGTWIGFADGDHAPLWIGPAEGQGVRELHIAFAALTRAVVLDFHAAAVSLSAEVLNPPRLFPEYHPNYFACFVRDPDGHNIEAVCHLPTAAG